VLSGCPAAQVLHEAPTPKRRGRFAPRERRGNSGHGLPQRPTEGCFAHLEAECDLPDGENASEHRPRPPEPPLRRAVSASGRASNSNGNWALSLGHFEGRSWTALHRHAPMGRIAFARLQHLRLAEHRRQAGRGWETPRRVPGRVPGPPPSPGLPAVRRAIAGRLFAHLVAPARYPRCRSRFPSPPDPEVHR